MNSNNWLSFPLSPTHPNSLPPHQFSLGLVNDTIETPFQNQGKLVSIYLFKYYYVYIHN